MVGVNENIAAGYEGGEEVTMALFIDLYVHNRGHRKAQMKRGRYFGAVHQCPHQEMGHMQSYLFTGAKFKMNNTAKKLLREALEAKPYVYTH